MKDLVIIGASGFAREVAWLVERINEENPTWNILGFVDANVELHNTAINGYPVLGGDEVLEAYSDKYVVCAIAAPCIRKRIIRYIKEQIPDMKFATLIDPSVVMSKWTSIGEGSIVCAHAILSVNVRIGSHVIIDWNSTIGHDAVIGDYMTIYPSASISGCTTIDCCTEFGTGSQIIQGKKAGEYAVVGAGAVVVRDIPPACTAVGVPARPIKYHNE